MSENKNIPKFEMIGHRLLDVNYSDPDFQGLQSFSITINELLLEENNICKMMVSIEIELQSEELNTYLFEVAYLINDTKWYDEHPNMVIDALFIQAYPFIRNSIFNVSKEFLNPILLPILNYKGLKKNVVNKFAKSE